jgi:tetratricopeptide (TPR) repeat protein
MASTPTVSQPTANELRRDLLWLAFIFIVVVVLYRISLSFGFVFDDHEQIVSSAAIRSWANARAAWTQHLWVESEVVAMYYRPFFLLWCYLNFVAFRLQPFGWHLVAVLLHAVASCSVFLLARKLRMEHWVAGIAALIFAVHPVHVEVVSWVSSSADALASVCFLLGFVAFLNTLEAGRRRTLWWAASLALVFCALFTKEFGVTFPGVVVAYCWIESRGQDLSRRLRNSVFAALPFVGLVAIYLGARAHALHGLAPQVTHRSSAWLLTVPLVAERFLEIQVFPIGLNAFYFIPYLRSGELSALWLPVLILAAAGLLLYLACRKQGTLTFAFWWMVITLAPVLYLPALPYAAYVRDRYTYLPSVGFAILVAMAFRRIPLQTGERPYLLRTVAAAVLIMALGFDALLQQTYWANDMAIAYRGYLLSPKSVIAETYYAQQLRERGEYGRSLAVLNHASTQVTEGGTSYYLLYYSLALTYMKIGRFAESRAAFARAEALDPNRNTAVALERKAALFGSMGDHGTAMDACNRVLPMAPDAYEIVFNCGYTHYLAGDYPGAERLLRHAADENPGEAHTHFYLGQALLRMNRLGDGKAELERAVQLDPKGEDLHAALAVAYELSGDSQAAIREYRAELQLHPGNKAAASRLAGLANQAVKP